MTSRARALPNLSRRWQSILIGGVIGVVVAGTLAWYFHYSRIEHYQAEWDNPRHPPVIGDGGRSVTLQYTGGACDDYSDTEVTERATTITITITVTTKAVTGCNDVGVPRTTTVRLDDPVGDRRLIDGAGED